MILRTPSISFGPLPMPVERTLASIVTSACSTPGRDVINCCACSFIVSRTGQAGVVNTILTETFEPQILMSPSGTKPRLTMSRWRSGSSICCNAARTDSLVTCPLEASVIFSPVYPRAVRPPAL